MFPRPFGLAEPTPVPCARGHVASTSRERGFGHLDRCLLLALRLAACCPAGFPKASWLADTVPCAASAPIPGRAVSSALSGAMFWKVLVAWDGVIPAVASSVAVFTSSAPTPEVTEVPADLGRLDLLGDQGLGRLGPGRILADLPCRSEDPWPESPYLAPKYWLNCWTCSGVDWYESVMASLIRLDSSVGRDVPADERADVLRVDEPRGQAPRPGPWPSHWSDTAGSSER